MAGQPGEYPPLRIAGYGLLGIAAVAAIVGLVSLAGGGSEASPDPSVTQAAPSESATPEPAPPAPAEPAPPAVAAPATPAPQDPLAPPAPAAPAPAAPAPATTAPPVAPALPGAGLPPSDDRAGGGKMGGSVSAARAPVRVYNNSLVHGLADRAAEDMRDNGWQVSEVGNWSYSNIPTSTVYYRPGTDEVAAARSLASDFGLRNMPRFAGIQGADPGLIVIVTKDYQRR